MAIFVKSCKRSMIVVLLACLVMGAFLVTPAFAAGKTGSLTVTYSHTDVWFSAYRVAERQSGHYVPVGDFFDLDVSFDAETSSEWQALAHTLAGYAADAIPDADARTENGVVTFRGLQRGLYLIVSEPYLMDGDTYTPIPILIELMDDAAEADGKYDQGEPGTDPKPEPEPEPEPDPKPESEPDPDRPKTGDESEILPYAGMFTMGAAVLAGLFLTRRKDGADHP